MEDPAEILAELRRLYDEKTAAAKVATDANKAHKAQEQVALDVLARAKVDSMRPTGVGYTFTAVTDAERGRVTDRARYYRWALEREPSIQDFMDNAVAQYENDANLETRDDTLREALYEAILNLSILKVVEQQRILNAQVKAAHDDETELPPGLDFDPVPYVSVTKA
jgi:ethanolamine ammonia-lyase large subunit